MNVIIIESQIKASGILKIYIIDFILGLCKIFPLYVYSVFI